MIRAVLFDVGGVLTPSLRSLVVPHILAAGVDVEAMQVALLPMLGTVDDSDEPAARWERGEIDLAGFVALTGEAGEHARVVLDPAAPHFLMQDFTYHPGMLELVVDVHTAGYRTAVVSNVVPEWVPAWRQALPRPELFDVIVFSCEVGLRKPNPDIFRHACERLDVDPTEALLLDDFGPMVDAARSIGVTGIHVEDHDTAIAAARTLLGL
jgi:putative hydrolase of the HAD superfamily